MNLYWVPIRTVTIGTILNLNGRSNGHGQRSAYIFTARKRSLRRLCFHRCLSVHGGGVFPHCMLGYTPRTRGRHPRQQTPPQDQTPPPRTRHPLPRCRYPLPWSRHTPELTPNPPPRSACWEIGATSGRYASYWNAYLLNSACLERKFCLNYLHLFITVSVLCKSMRYFNISGRSCTKTWRTTVESSSSISE